MVVKQGQQLGNMGNKPENICTGVHCHIEFAKGKQSLVKNQYGVWGLTNAVEFEDACFMDNTNIIFGQAQWKYLKDVPVETTKYLNISPVADYRTVYKDSSLKTKAGEIKPKKYNGLSYKVLGEYPNEVVKINTTTFGQVYISAKSKYYGTITTSPTYQNGNY